VPRPTRPGAFGAGQSGAPARRPAWAEGVERLRAGAGTEPGRLRIIGAVLALLIIAFGAVTSWQTTERAGAAAQVLHHSQPLSADAADIYRSLADANTTESSGFLAGGQEPTEVRDTYANDIATAADKLAKAASNTQDDPESAKVIAVLNQLLPRYTGYIERARANNRNGLPLGAAYLRLANDLMQKQMLVQAQKLYENENGQLHADYDDATPYPWVAIGLGAGARGALVWAQRRTYRQTNRVFNSGLLAATAATAVALLWLVVGHTVARIGLNDSYQHGVRSLTVLDDARIASLQARSNENLTLVNRGAETVKDENGTMVDAYDYEFNKEMSALGGSDGSGGLLGRAAALADDAAGQQPVAGAVANVKVWKSRHSAARDEDNQGYYAEALSKIIGAPGKPPTGDTTGDAFNKVDDALGRALDQERAEFRASAEDGRAAMEGLPVGAAVLAVLGSAGAVLGIGRRLSEYR
jgi:CHASE3 domain sensor protein